MTGARAGHTHPGNGLPGLESRLQPALRGRRLKPGLQPRPCPPGNRNHLPARGSTVTAAPFPEAVSTTSAVPPPAGTVARSGDLSASR